MGNPPRQCMQTGGRNAPKSSRTHGSSAHAAPDMKSSVAPDLQRSGNLISQHDSRAYPIAGSWINPASMCPDFSHTHLLLRRCSSISLAIFLAFLSYMCTLPSLSHIPAFLCIPAGPFSRSLEVYLSYKDMLHTPPLLLLEMQTFLYTSVLLSYTLCSLHLL